MAAQAVSTIAFAGIATMPGDTLADNTTINTAITDPNVPTDSDGNPIKWYDSNPAYLLGVLDEVWEFLKRNNKHVNPRRFINRRFRRPGSDYKVRRHRVSYPPFEGLYQPSRTVHQP